MKYNYHTHLPIYQKRNCILDAIIKNQVVIVAGETGSGKTTQLPLICIEAGRGVAGKVVCTQPRRIAAVSLASYTASCCDSVVGKEIGFQVRFRENVSDETKIVFVTDGILLGEILNDPFLKRFDTIIIDEAHERSINIDFLIGHLRSILLHRPDLKVIISSATIDTRLFSRAFNNAPVITVSGRLFPVDIQYRPVIELWKGEGMDSFIEGTIVVVKEILDKKEPGDILVFFPTVQDIVELTRRLKHIVGNNSVLLPLHSRLHVAQQQLIFRKFKQRKIVIATNIAETSITVPGIRFVIDSGLVRMHRYEPSAQLSRMPIERISKASADQRAGRCGRVQEGICIRLYSELDYMSRQSFTTPEIQRANLADVILRMSYNGLGDPAKFLFLQRPPYLALKSAFQQLQELGAINKKGQITSLGKEMARLPLDPPVARMLIYAREQDAVRELMVIAAGLSVDDPFVVSTEKSRKRNSLLHSTESDFMRLLNVWKTAKHAFWKKLDSSAYFNDFCKTNDLSPVKMNEWFDAYQQIRRICRSIKGFVNKRSQSASYEAIHKSLLSGFYSGLACRSEKDIYNGIHVDGIRIFPSSVLFCKNPRWVLFHEIVETSRIYGRTVAVIRPEWVEMMFRSKCNYVCEETWYDTVRGVVRAREEVSFKGMVLLKNRHIDLERKDPERAHEVFIKEALVKELIGERYRFIGCNRQLRDRINLLQHKLRKNLYTGDWAL
jgi:ATP-dependent helicase HrpA